MPSDATTAPLRLVGGDHQPPAPERRRREEAKEVPLDEAAIRARVEAMERQIADREYHPPQPPPRVAARTTTATSPSAPKADPPSKDEPAPGTGASPKTEPAADRGVSAADPAPLDVEPVEIR